MCHHSFFFSSADGTTVRQHYLFKISRCSTPKFACQRSSAPHSQTVKRDRAFLSRPPFYFDGLSLSPSPFASRCCVRLHHIGYGNGTAHHGTVRGVLCDVFQGDRRASYCAEHKLLGMINVASRRCQHPGCLRHPNFGFPGDRRASYCRYDATVLLSWYERVKKGMNGCIHYAGVCEHLRSFVDKYGSCIMW